MGNNGKEALMRKRSSALAKRTEPVERSITPVADIYETADAFVVKLDIPGATKDSISVSVEPGYLSAKGLVGPHHTEDANLLLGEIGRRSYFREFNLTEGINHKEVEAQFEDGVLTIRLPKTDEMKLKEIPIK